MKHDILSTTIDIEKKIDSIKTAIEQMGTKVRELKTLFELIDQTSLIMWIKNDTLKMLWCSSEYERLYLTPRGLTREKDYYNNDDYSTWPSDIAKKFRNHDRLAISKKSEMIYDEEVILDEKNQVKKFKKCPVEIGDFYGIVGWQIN